MNDNNFKTKFSQKQIIIAILVIVFLFLIGVVIFAQNGNLKNANSSNSNSSNSSQKTNSSINSQISSVVKSSDNSQKNSQSSSSVSSTSEISPKKANSIPANPTPVNLLKSSEKSVAKSAEAQNSLSVQLTENNSKTKDELPEADWKPVTTQKPSTAPEG